MSEARWHIKPGGGLSIYHESLNQDRESTVSWIRNCDGRTVSEIGIWVPWPCAFVHSIEASTAMQPYNLARLGQPFPPFLHSPFLLSPLPFPLSQGLHFAAYASTSFSLHSRRLSSLPYTFSIFVHFSLYIFSFISNFFLQLLYDSTPSQFVKLSLWALGLGKGHIVGFYELVA